MILVLAVTALLGRVYKFALGLRIRLDRMARLVVGVGLLVSPGVGRLVGPVLRC